MIDLRKISYTEATEKMSVSDVYDLFDTIGAVEEARIKLEKSLEK